VRPNAGNLTTALDYFNKSLELNKDYEKARSWQQKVRRVPAPPGGSARPRLRSRCASLSSPRQVVTELNPEPAGPPPPAPLTAIDGPGAPAGSDPVEAPPPVPQVEY
jgi:hypothetical protein